MSQVFRWIDNWLTYIQNDSKGNRASTLVIMCLQSIYKIFR